MSVNLILLSNCVNNDITLCLFKLIIVYGWVVYFNPLTAKLFYFYFHSLKVVSRWRDTQLQVSENYSDLTE